MCDRSCNREHWTDEGNPVSVTYIPPLPRIYYKADSISLVGSSARPLDATAQWPGVIALDDVVVGPDGGADTCPGWIVPPALELD
jgi:hypothetical protein